MNSIPQNIYSFQQPIKQNSSLAQKNNNVAFTGVNKLAKKALYPSDKFLKAVAKIDDKSQIGSLPSEFINAIKKIWIQLIKQ